MTSSKQAGTDGARRAGRETICSQELHQSVSLQVLLNTDTRLVMQVHGTSLKPMIAEARIVGSLSNEDYEAAA